MLWVPHHHPRTRQSSPPRPGSTPTSAPDIATATPDGYIITNQDCTNNLGGGTVIIHKETIQSTTTTPMEHLNFKLHTDDKTPIRGTLAYRHPGLRSNFCNTIADFTAPIALDSKSYIFLADLNFHIDDPTDKNTTHHLDSMSSLGLTQIIHESTHCRTHTGPNFHLQQLRQIQPCHRTHMDRSLHRPLKHLQPRPPLPRLPTPYTGGGIKSQRPAGRTPSTPPTLLPPLTSDREEKMSMPGSPIAQTASSPSRTSSRENPLKRPAGTPKNLRP